MDWLERLGVPAFRLNGEDLDGGSVVAVKISDRETKVCLMVDGYELNFNDIQAVWFRRWVRERRHEKANLVRSCFDATGNLNDDIKRHLTLESRRLSGFLFSCLADRPWLCDPDSGSLNKLQVLKRAADAGLSIPATLVTNERNEVLRFFTSHGPLITKPIGEAHAFFDGDRVHFTYTSVVDFDAIEALPERFAPSLFQENVEKEFEVRVFYLEGECYAMAIFSQLDRQTKIDFRQYNHVRPNRYVPYLLSADIVAAIRRLMSGMSLETGSIDLIRTPMGRTVFLEINPVGQFGMVSEPCNYQLERKVAEYIVREVEYGGRL